MFVRTTKGTAIQLRSPIALSGVLQLRSPEKMRTLSNHWCIINGELTWGKTSSKAKVPFRTRHGVFRLLKNGSGGWGQTETAWNTTQTANQVYRELLHKESAAALRQKNVPLRVVNHARQTLVTVSKPALLPTHGS